MIMRTISPSQWRGAALPPRLCDPPRHIRPVRVWRPVPDHRVRLPERPRTLAAVWGHSAARWVADPVPR